MPQYYVQSWWGACLLESGECIHLSGGASTGKVLCRETFAASHRAGRRGRCGYCTAESPWPGYCSGPQRQVGDIILMTSSLLVMTSYAFNVQFNMKPALVVSYWLVVCCCVCRYECALPKDSGMSCTVSSPGKLDCKAAYVSAVCIESKSSYIGCLVYSHLSKICRVYSLLSHHSLSSGPLSLRQKLKEKVTFRLDFNFGGKVCWCVYHFPQTNVWYDNIVMVIHLLLM